MDNHNKTKKDILFSEDFFRKVEYDFKNIVNTDDIKKAKELAEALEKALSRVDNSARERQGYIKKYQEMVIKAEFIALPILEDFKIERLIKKNFTAQFLIDDYNIFQKFNFKLVNIYFIENRDKLKGKIKKALAENTEIITSQAVIKRINEWIRDYNVNLGAGLVDNLKRTQYYIDIEKTKNVNNEEVKKLKTLFEFYEKLKLSSFTPRGFEEEVPMLIDGKYYIFRQGELELIGKAAVKARRVSGPPETEEEKEMKTLKQMEEKYDEKSLERLALEEEIKKKKKIEELKIIANKYKEGSLERRAIEEEIKKLDR